MEQAGLDLVTSTGERAFKLSVFSIAWFAFFLAVLNHVVFQLCNPCSLLALVIE